jgi:N-acylneuraminate cytidylyltransferase/CMP-N,N'-diacetyllegionaminic acid synthase
MINKKRILAVVPARSGSKGLKNKNLKVLGGKPLFAHPLEALKKSKYVDKIVLSTDSDKVIKISRKYGSFVFFKRPKKISKDSSTTFEVLDHTLNLFSKKNDFYDYILCLEPTSPFTTSQDIDLVIEKVLKKKNYNSAVSISFLEKQHPNFIFSLNKKKIITPFLKGKKFNCRRQEISKLYYLDGSLYFSNVKSFYKNKGFIGSKTYGYITPKWKALEIDDFFDFEFAKLTFKKFKNE